MRSAKLATTFLRMSVARHGMPSIEVATVEKAALLRIDERVVVHSVRFRLEQLTAERKRRRGEPRPHGVHSAPSRDPESVPSPRRSLARGLRGSVRSGLTLPRVRFQREDPIVEVAGLTFEHIGSHRGQRARELGETLRPRPRQTAKCGHHAGTVQESQAFFGAQGSAARDRLWREPSWRKRTRFHDGPLARRPGPRRRKRVASGLRWLPPNPQTECVE